MGQSALEADQLGAEALDGSAGVVEPVGIDQPGQVVVGAVADVEEEAVFGGLMHDLASGRSLSRCTSRVQAPGYCQDSRLRPCRTFAGGTWGACGQRRAGNSPGKAPPSRKRHPPA